MYSSMMTPVCTETPKSARKPTPEETLKWVPVTKSASNPPMLRHGDGGENQHGPFRRAEHRIEDDEDEQDRQRNDNEQPRVGAYFALVFAFPPDVIPAREFYLRIDLLDSLSNSVAESAAAHAVFDGDVALIVFAIDFRALVRFAYVAELSQRNPLSRGREQANILDGFRVSRY